MKSILSIAGLDTCGGAGLHADIKTIKILGFHPASVVTAITFQNTCGISGMMSLHSGVIERQLSAIFEDLRVEGVKIGMVNKLEVAEVIVDKIKGLSIPRVLDPVIRASVGFDLGLKDAYETIARSCDVITPNVEEAMQFSGMKIEDTESARMAAEKIADVFNCSVVITGGKLEGKDVVYDVQHGKHHTIEAELIAAEVHGTGCVYSSALVCYLAKGFKLFIACEKARDFVLQAIKRRKMIGKCMPIADPS
jgi:hydroxymethylpyrimidine/phosphomethylpyrimidine kinase